MGIQDIPNPALSPGELIIVSGANGFIASHVADQALAAGFRVRGTTRSAEKHAWLQEHFDAAYGLRKFELIEVKDMVAEGAFDEAVKGTHPLFFAPKGNGILALTPLPNRRRRLHPRR